MTNKEAFSEAKKYIPGGVNSPVRAFGSVGGEPVMIDHAKGAYLYDVEGKKYLDFIQSWGPLIFGHCDKDIEEAIISAVKQGVSYGAPSPKETALAKLICDEFKQIDKIRFVSSGTEATMSAIRVARGYAKKDGLIKFEGCYHGHSDALLIKAGSGATTYGNASSGGVPQDVVLFKGTVRENIVQKAPYVDDMQIIKAAKVSGVDEYVNAHPLGFDMPVFERGDGISGGQRQSIAVARAFLLDSPIILLDEPTNSLDNTVESKLKANLKVNTVNKTMILVTHRTSMLDLVDRLIVMDNGKILLDGPRDEVLARLSGK